MSRPHDPVFERLDTALPWSDIDLFQVDERAAPRASSDRNLTEIERTLPTAIRVARVHPMPVDGDLVSGADAYAASLSSVCGDPPVLDVVHLGLGTDGHTASLLPGDPVLDVYDRSVAVTGEHGGFRRMTLTYPVLSAARLVVFVVLGADKQKPLKRLMDGDRTIPATRIDAPDVRILADQQAVP